MSSANAVTEKNSKAALAILTAIDADTSKIPTNPSTEGKQDAVIAKLSADPATATIQSAGNGIIAAVRNELQAGGVTGDAVVATRVAVEVGGDLYDQQTAILAKATTAESARKFVAYTQVWTAEDGTNYLEFAVPSGEYWAHAQSHVNAQAAGAVSYTLYISTEAAFTPGASAGGFYTSDAALVLPIGVNDSNLAPVPITVTGDKVYMRVIPDVGGGNTTTGTATISLTPNL